MKLLRKDKFKATVNGFKTGLFTLRNKKGCVAQFSNYGARWLSMWVPDKNNLWSDVLLGFESLEEYMKAEEKYYGAIVGRVCGRINNGTFELEGVRYQLTANDVFGETGKNHLHGGFEGFSFKVWRGEISTNQAGEETLEFSLFSGDGEEGYPGNLVIKVIYTLCNDNSVKINYSAKTDKPTVVNLTNHAYFNLHNGADKNVLNHSICIYAESSIECNNDLIPTGKILPLKNTPLDFSEPRTIGSRMNESYPGQLIPDKGYVVSYILNGNEKSVRLAAIVNEPDSGRSLEVFTDQPCIQFYNASLFTGTDIGKNGRQHTGSSGFALETQGYPDAPNHPDFLPIILSPEEEYEQTTIYRFIVK